MVRLVEIEGLRLTMAGVSRGVVDALTPSPLKSSLLFGVHTRDPLPSRLLRVC
jgi:hypothetical protein